MMNDFVRKVIEGSGISPPSVCQQTLAQNFPGAVNPEWSRINEGFEAVFYRDSLEHIALFSPDGRLLEYKINLSAAFLPEALKKQLEERGEIMNAVLRNKGNRIEYEIILRDKEMNRVMITFLGTGKLLGESPL